MRAVFRLTRASILLGRIFGSYAFQLAIARLWRSTPSPERWNALHRRNAKRLYRGIIRLQGVYIKMGQVLSVMGTFLPPAYMKELETLQDRVPPRPWKEMARTFIASLGCRPGEVFAAFDEKPLAAASLGQVHRARLASGRDVAVKILYPDVTTVIRIDLTVLGWAMKVCAWFVPIRALERVIEQLRDLLSRETNYLNEARCMERMARNFADDPSVLFPEVVWDLTTDRVLTMSFMPGIQISRRAELEGAGIDPYVVARKLIESFYKQLLVDRFFQAGPHPGNFLVQQGPRLVILDFGAATETPPNLITGFVDVLAAAYARNDALLIEGIESMGFVALDGDRRRMHDTIRSYFAKLLELDVLDFSRTGPEVARRLAHWGMEPSELRALMKNVVYPDGWFFVERAVVILFGLCTQLAPKLDALRLGFPHVMRLRAAVLRERG